MESHEASSDYQENVYDMWMRQRGLEVKDLRIREIIWRMTGNKKCKILDVGCGDGSLLEPFCKHQDCYGVDISEAQLKRAHEKNIKTFRVDLEAEELPFPRGFFDFVVCSETIEHLLDIDNLLLQINRKLRFDGTFILTFPNVNQPISWLIQIAFDLPPVYSARYKSPHVRDYTLRIVKKALTNFGFNIERVTGTYMYPFEGRLSQWLAKSFPRLGEKIIVVSKKNREVETIRPQKVVWNVLELLR